MDNSEIPDDDSKAAELPKTSSSGSGGFIPRQIGVGSSDFGDDNLNNTLELRFGVNYMALDSVEPDKELFRLLPEAFMIEHQAAIVGRRRQGLILAMVNPNNIFTLDGVRAMHPGIRISSVVCTGADIEAFMLRSARNFLSAAELENALEQEL